MPFLPRLATAASCSVRPGGGWKRPASRNAVRILIAEAETQQYIADRTDAFRAHPGFERLASLEEAVFHYQQDATDNELDEFPGTTSLDEL
ncbi:hypothetical protein [Streptomyces sp. SID10853]|uniref:hypothetical protein n=1 Tax=Streptomyces sp. SID10853 TaxID=2706028 RepID=UPI001EF2529B|nr:hypothetical protein [Streptomyces sp. SID10853]